MKAARHGYFLNFMVRRWLLWVC